MTVLQAAAVLVLWRSRRFDAADIAAALGGLREADVCRVLHAVRERERRPGLRLIDGEAAE